MYLNVTFGKTSVEPNGNLTLTRVVFEWTVNIPLKSEFSNLTLTRVVFECNLLYNLFILLGNLTLTRVVFEWCLYYRKIKKERYI